MKMKQWMEDDKNKPHDVRVCTCCGDGDGDSAYRIAVQEYFGEFARNYENKN